MFQFIYFFIFLIILPFILSQRFFDIFAESDGSVIRGIAKNEPLFAIVTNNFVIFGNFTNDMKNFTEIHRSYLSLSKTDELLEFKFVDNEAIVVCDKNECDYCDSSGQTLKKAGCVMIASFPLESVTIHKSYTTLFIRAVHNSTTAEIYTYKLENGTFQKFGEAADRTSKNHEFKAIYGFSYNYHIYFISHVRRADYAMEILSNSTDMNFTQINSDIVITQICENDESKDIISRMDLVLACKNVYLNSKFVRNIDDKFEEKVTAAAYLANDGMLFLGIEKPNKSSFLCKFKMFALKSEFERSWNYCQSVTERHKNCNVKNYKKLLNKGCFKLSLKNNKLNQKFPLCKKFGLQKKAIPNSCEAALSSTTDRRYGWLENVNPFFGDFIKIDSDNYIQALYPLSNGKEFLILQNTNLIKTVFANVFIRVLPILTKLEFQISNSKMLTPWDSKDAILYVEPIKKNTIYFKKITCTEKDCFEILVNKNLRCGICDIVDEKKDCLPNIFQTQCAPFWIKAENLHDNLNESILDAKTENANKINQNKGQTIICNEFVDENNEICGESLPNVNDSYAYLEPILIKNKNIKSHMNIGTKSIKIIKSGAVKNEKSFTVYLNVLWPIALVIGILIGLLVIRNTKFQKTSIKNSPTSLNKQSSKNGKVSSLTYKKVLSNDSLISVENIKFLDELGQGNSAYVRLAEYKTKSTTKKVAVKKLKLEKYDETEIMEETIRVGSCEHANIVKFIGWMMVDEKICMITEFMEGGNLHNYLKDQTKPLTLKIISSYIFQVLDGMTYLSHKHILHRDLAARNCLLDKNYTIIKITDFGVSREMDENYEYISERGCYLPFRYLPPEALCNNIHTLKGDVWSFAVLVWEMFEQGEIPYQNFTAQGVITFLNEKGRLARPEYCPLKIYKIMKSCWNKDAEQRPNFESLKKDIKIIFNKMPSESMNLPLRDVI